MRDVPEVRREEYDARLEVMALRRAVYEEHRDERSDELLAAEVRLSTLTDERAELVAASGTGRAVLSPATTKLDVTVRLRLTHVPAALVHLFDAGSRPLVGFTIRNVDSVIRRVCITTFVDGYSAHAVETVEVAAGDSAEVLQLPTFFPEKLSTIHELTRATVNIEVRDLDARTELHRTLPVWLLPRTTAPLSVLDPGAGAWKDTTRYLGAFVTPHAPRMHAFVRAATDCHPNHRFIGYQLPKEEVALQVQALFDALKKHGVRYVNSALEFARESGAQNQRVRLPRETLDEQQGNCIDTTLLMASLLEAVSLAPALVIVPGHAFLGWETWRKPKEASNDWRYLETTMIATSTFEEACAEGEKKAAYWKKQSQEKANPDFLRRWALRDLRAEGITPVE